MWLKNFAATVYGISKYRRGPIKVSAHVHVLGALAGKEKNNSGDHPLEHPRCETVAVPEIEIVASASWHEGMGIACDDRRDDAGTTGVPFAM